MPLLLFPILSVRFDIRGEEASHGLDVNPVAVGDVCHPLLAHVEPTVQFPDEIMPDHQVQRPPHGIVAQVNSPGHLGDQAAGIILYPEEDADRFHAIQGISVRTVR